jgi:hypothetical protein
MTCGGPVATQDHAFVIRYKPPRQPHHLKATSRRWNAAPVSSRINLPLTWAAWLETAGPKRCITWIAETCDEIAIRDIPTWRFWIKMGSLFRDIAAALPAYNEMPSDDVPRPRSNEQLAPPLS